MYICMDMQKKVHKKWKKQQDKQTTREDKYLH